MIDKPLKRLNLFLLVQFNPRLKPGAKAKKDYNRFNGFRKMMDTII